MAVVWTANSTVVNVPYLQSHKLLLTPLQCPLRQQNQGSRPGEVTVSTLHFLLPTAAIITTETINRCLLDAMWGLAFKTHVEWEALCTECQHLRLCANTSKSLRTQKYKLSLIKRSSLSFHFKSRWTGKYAMGNFLNYMIASCWPQQSHIWIWRVKMFSEWLSELECLN